MLYRFAPHLQNGITVRTPHECPCDRQATMVLSETATSDNCLYCCLAVPLSGFGNVRVMPFCLPTHTTFTTNQLFYNFSSAIQEAVLVHSGILNVADMSATSNLPQCPAARTRHICHADRSARFVRCATVSSCLIYVTIYFSIILLCPTPLRSVTWSVVIQTSLADGNTLLLAKADSMPKYRRERIVCPCYKLSRLKL